MQILVIEDDEKIADFVVRGLKQEGHAVERVADGTQGLSVLLAHDFDVAVVDVMLPGRDGLTLIREARARGDETPVLVLSARAEVDDRVRGLRAGADDYLTKPFSYAELVARLEALQRRSGGGAPTTVCSAEGVTLDLATRRVTREGVPIELQPREFALLAFLVRHAGRVVSRTMILEAVYGYSFDPQTNVVQVLVSRLRAKVDRDFDDKLIHTVRGVGYVFRREGDDG